MSKMYFKDITLLITHYNRSKSLERLLKSFEELNCSFEDTVVSDDYSSAVHLTHVRSIQNQFPFRLITAEKNMGLGININKRHDSVVPNFYSLCSRRFCSNKRIYCTLSKRIRDFSKQ